MKISKLPILLVLCVCAIGAVTAAQPLLARDALIGKWKATITPDDGGKETTDNIAFKGGKFSSENEKADGFEEATYDDDPSPQGISAKFSVTLKNKAGDTAKWSGFSTGTEMDGTLEVTKKDGSKTSYTFKASKG
jgi:hypothetical protein